MRRLLLASSITAILAGCGADKQSYDTLPRDIKEIAVKDLKTEGRWFYVPTTGAAPRFAINQFPFLQGMGRYAEVCFSERGLEVRNYDSNYPDATLPKDANGYCIPQPSNAVGSDKQTNFSHILTIPGDFAAYRCQEDRYGDCVNKEEANKDANLPFRANTHFTPKPEDLLIAELNWEDFYGIREGISEIGKAELISWKFDPKAGVLNFEIERTFKIDEDKRSSYIKWENRAGLRDAIQDGAFKSRFHYSLVHESQLASADYQPIPYPVKDENDIGFFTTSSKVLDPVTNRYDRTVTYLNRFNPNQPIEYYLSDSFFEPKNKLFLDSTLETINLMNRTLKIIEPDSGKPPITIVNHNQPMNIHPGDLRYNVINLIDEPLANGLLGYGPSVSHPLTGEILKAHVNQYSGVARAGVPFYWDNLVRFYNRGQIERSLSDSESITTAHAQSTQALSQDIAARLAQQNVLRLMEQVERVDTTQFQVPLLGADHALNQRPSARLPESIFRKFDDDMSLEELLHAEERRLATWSENNIYPVEATWVSSTSKTLLDNLPLTDAGFFDTITNAQGEQVKQLKRWSALPSELKQQAADAITVATYASTLVHELGHNLGLRHNFKGSNDKANFYTQQEAKAIGLNNIPAYSSIMDYAPSMLDQLPTWGKYDLAALKFAYGRKIDITAPANSVHAQSDAENPFILSARNPNNPSLLDCQPRGQLNDGQVRYSCDLSTFDAIAYNAHQSPYRNALYEQVRYGAINYLAQIKQQHNLSELAQINYQFCTDGNVSLNSDCNRFDEGTNLTEIVTYSWQRHLDSYDARNIGIHGISGLFNSDYPSYVLRRFREMNEIRDILEDHERIDYLYRSRGIAPAGAKPGDFLSSLTSNPEYCRGQDTDFWFCDLGNASKLAAQFFLDVLATPEHQCVLQNGNQYRVESLGHMLNGYSFKIPATYNIGDASCFDSVSSEIINDFARGFTPVAETVNGRFINSVKGFDPDFPWSNAVSVLGIWPDKLLASNLLARRYSLRQTDEVSYANLLDLPGVKAQFDNIMANLIAKEALNTPLALRDKDGNAYTLPINSGVTVNLHKTELLESLPPLPDGIMDDFNISKNSRNNLASLILQQAVEQMQSNDFEVRSRGIAQYDSWTKQQDRSGTIAGETIQFDLYGQLYVASKANTMAYQYASALQANEGYQLTTKLQNYSNAELREKTTQIETAWNGILETIIPAFHSPIKALNPELIQRFVDLKIDEGDDEVERFIAFINALAMEDNTPLLKKENRYQNRDNPLTFSLPELYNIFWRSRALFASDFQEQYFTAVDNVAQGYANESVDQQFFWTADLSLINAYANGEFERVAGQYYQILDSLPISNR
ncbi:zinc-dependent metalloprotease [Vibrio metschnikovii]|uniref:zinc-dependent metalloprotease n=1 Tax=Vibrio metschnikovii TaxID=28172 RepID=UPI002FC74879